MLFDLPTRVCAWRALRRSRQRGDFWRWLLTWRRRCLPQLMAAIEAEGDELELFVIRDDADRDRTVVGADPKIVGWLKRPGGAALRAGGPAR